jgi:hypothetical protein
MHQTRTQFAIFLLVALIISGHGIAQEKKKRTADKASGEKGPVIEALYAIDTPGFDKLKQGETIKIKGQCGSLRDGKLALSLSKPYYGNRPAIPAPDLVKEFVAEPERAKKKYESGCIVIEGVVKGRLGNRLIISGSESPKSGTVKGETVASLEAALAKSSPAFTLTVSEFEAEYKKDAKAADQKYGGKIIDVSGTVSVVGQDALGDDCFVLLSTKGLGVYCKTIDDQPWARVGSEQKVKMRGTCPPKADRGYLEQCMVIEKDKSYAPVTIASDQLAKEFTKAQEEARKKFHEKTVIVKGEVTAKREDKDGDISLTLKGDGNVNVICYVRSPNKGQANVVQVGGSVKLVGSCSFFEKTAQFIGCNFIYDAPAKKGS